MSAKSQRDAKVSQNSDDASSYMLLLHTHLAMKGRMRNRISFITPVCNLKAHLKMRSTTSIFIIVQGGHFEMVLFQFLITFPDKIRHQIHSCASLGKCYMLPVMGLFVAYSKSRTGFRAFSELKQMSE